MQRLNTEERAPLGAPALSNNPCNVKITIEVEGRPAHVYTIGDEKDARNLLARLVPVSIFTASPAEVFPHINDGTQPMFEDLLADAKALSLSLPAGI